MFSNVCRLIFRRIEDTQEIDVEDTGPRTDFPSATSIERPPTVKTPKLQLPEEDISRYRHIRVIDTIFKIRKACGSDVSLNRSILSMRHLDDPDSLVEELVRRWGLPEEDCMKVVVEYQTHLSALRAEFPDHGAASNHSQRSQQLLPSSNSIFTARDSINSFGNNVLHDDRKWEDILHKTPHKNEEWMSFPRLKDAFFLESISCPPTNSGSYYQYSLLNPSPMYIHGGYSGQGNPSFSPAKPIKQCLSDQMPNFIRDPSWVCVLRQNDF